MYLPMCADPNCPNKVKVEELEEEVKRLNKELRELDKETRRLKEDDPPYKLGERC